MARRKYHLNEVRSPDLPWVEGCVIGEDTACVECDGPLEFVGTQVDVEIHECTHCRQQHRALERAGREPRRASVAFGEE